MKQIKSILSILILAIAVVGVAPTAMAQKEPIKTCPKCGKAYKGTHVCPKAEKPKPKPKPDPKPKPKPKQEPKPEPKPNPKPEPKPNVDTRPVSDQTFTVNGVTFTMVGVQGGTFTMGATSEQGSDADRDEKPAHNVTLSSYYIGQAEVTQELWEAVMGSNPSYFKGAKRPVENVSWEDCQEFISRLNAKTGKNFRLPTEAEWEYAARGGNRSQHYMFSGGDNIFDVAWYDKNSYDKGSSHPDYGTHPVATKRANELGLYDMSGNVWEWCSDWYGSYSSSSQTNPEGPSTGSSRVFRGGCWDSVARYCRVSNRSWSSADLRYYYLGLRLAL